MPGKNIMRLHTVNGVGVSAIFAFQTKRAFRVYKCVSRKKAQPAASGRRSRLKFTRHSLTIDVVCRAHVYRRGMCTSLHILAARVTIRPAAPSVIESGRSVIDLNERLKKVTRLSILLIFFLSIINYSMCTECFIYIANKILTFAIIKDIYYYQFYINVIYLLSYIFAYSNY